VADFDSLDEVRGLATLLLDRYPRIDVLVNNAGGLVSKRGYSQDGFERTLQHNHLAHFLLTDLLLPRLLESHARVISTSSVANRWAQIRLDDLNWRRRPYLGGWRAYGSSKAMAIMFAAELARRTGLDAYSFHPGYISSRFGADAAIVKLSWLLANNRIGKTTEQGAAPILWLATANDVGAPSGTYFDGVVPSGRVHRSVTDRSLAAELWRHTAELVGATNLVPASSS
jgi:NAD(P)-dependent dehydrogenase (short-subunit alcohol dehydrogenase family)